MRLLIIPFFVFLLGLNACIERNPTLDDGGKIVVLMYHRVVRGEAVSTYERNLDDFEKDIQFFTNKGINIITFRDLEIFLLRGAIPEGNHVIITFDDGDISWYEIVRPLFIRYGISGTFFVWTDQIGEKNFIDKDMLEMMSRYQYPDETAPFIFGSHTFTHPYLAAKRSDFSTDNEYNAFLDYEMRESKQLIESLTGKPVTALALPYGDGAGDQYVRAAALRNGYSVIRTSERFSISDPAADLLRIPGIAILNDTSLDQIASWFGFSD